MLILEEFRVMGVKSTKLDLINAENIYCHFLIFDPPK